MQDRPARHTISHGGVHHRQRIMGRDCNAIRGKALLDYCTWTSVMGTEQGGGGVGRAGSKGRLNIVIYNIVIYQWGSAFDLAITSEIRPDSLSLGGVNENGTMVKSSASGWIGKP